MNQPLAYPIPTNPTDTVIPTVQTHAYPALPTNNLTQRAQRTYSYLSSIPPSIDLPRYMRGREDFTTPNTLQGFSISSLSAPYVTAMPWKQPTLPSPTRMQRLGSLGHVSKRGEVPSPALSCEMMIGGVTFPLRSERRNIVLEARFGDHPRRR